MKRIYLLLAILLGSLQLANAQQQTLLFNKDGKFKIVQFTDVHYIYNDPRSDVSIRTYQSGIGYGKARPCSFYGRCDLW